MVGAGLVLQAALPRLANDTGVLYLRAQYKLATGDPGSALKLMQQAATPSGSQSQAKAATPTAQDSECPYTRAKSIARAIKPSAATPHIISVRQITPTKTHVQRVTMQIPDRWSMQQMQIMAQIQARQVENEGQLRETLAKVDAKLRNLPGVTVPLNVPAVIVSGTRAAVP